MVVPPDVVARIRGGDHDAFTVAFRALYRPLCLYVLQAYAGDLADAEDIVQRVFIELWQGRARLGDIVSLRAYLYEATRSRALTTVTRERRRAQLLTEHARDGGDRVVAGPDSRLERAEAFAEVSRAIAELPARCRAAFVLRRYDGLSYAEIAQRLGMAVRTVEAHIARGHRILQAKLR
jgi:RNA polymerase sigma-70 factor (ECF subfamily)